MRHLSAISFKPVVATAGYSGSLGQLTVNARTHTPLVHTLSHASTVSKERTDEQTQTQGRPDTHSAASGVHGQQKVMGPPCYHCAQAQ